MIERTRIGKDGVQERAILVGLATNKVPFELAQEYLDELEFLAQTAGALTVKKYLQRLDQPHHAHYVGSGKLEELAEAVEALEANLVIFDDDLSPAQIRNISDAVNVKVLDRSSLILYIFSERAQTAQARKQVDLAQYQYLLPRLTGMWTHLSRQRGGIGLKGAGEKEIETDRRILRDKIAKLKHELDDIATQDSVRRKNRGELVRVALVGYTNVGKSTLMNLLSKSDVLAEDKLFATLDTTVRKITYLNIPFLLSDTVGFIRKLPHHLVESFRSTLDEVRESDILLHIVDASHPRYQHHIDVVKQTLLDLKIQDKTIITVFNKVDKLSTEQRAELESAWVTTENLPAVCISAASREGIDLMRDTMVSHLVRIYREKYPNYAAAALREWEYIQMAMQQQDAE